MAVAVVVGKVCLGVGVVAVFEVSIELDPNFLPQDGKR